MDALTPDEETVLLITAQGGSVAPIAGYEMPVKNLALKGLLYYIDQFNYGITGAGREAAAALDKQHDAALGALIERSSAIGTAQKRIIDFAEQAAQLLAASALASSKVTGDPPGLAANRWSQTILARAQELLQEKQDAIPGR